MNEKKFLITTSLPYMNASLHIGHAYELVLADVVARYHRQKGEKVFFLTGADEHGDKIIAAAQKEGIGPQMFVDKNVARFKELIEKLSITNDDFIRTSDKEMHWPGAIKLWQEIAASGDIYKGTYKGLYCVGCEAFITEKELVDGKCPHHATTPEKIEEENYFFKLSKYAPEIKRLLESGDLKVTPK
ncbi:MAG: Methionine-tRNA ligase, partial [Candidatus Nomurabacteria bacterium GW2011_GWA2_42_41]